MQKEHLKVGLVDDHNLVREAIANMIRSFDKYSISITANNGRDLIDKMTEDNKPQILILDVSMPEMDGYDTALWLAKYHPEIKVMLLTVYHADSLVHLIRTGVRGLLQKDVQPEELKKSLSDVNELGIYCSKEMTGQIFGILRNQFSNSSGWRNITLSETEITFLRYVATEMTYKEIAHLMKVSPRTVDNYRDQLFAKLDVKSRVGLVLYAIKSGIVDIYSR